MPWKSARYVCMTLVERLYFFIIAGCAWQLAQRSGLFIRQPGACGPAMSCEWWQSVHVGTSAFFPSLSARPCTLFAYVADTPAWQRGARLGDPRPRLRRVGDVVRAVAVDARRGHPVAAGDRRVVDAVEGLAVVGEMTPLARLVVRDGELAPRLERLRGVRDVGDVGVAVGASELAAVDRPGEFLAVDEQASGFTARQRHRHRLVAVAGEAPLDVLVLRLRDTLRLDRDGDDERKEN